MTAVCQPVSLINCPIAEVTGADLQVPLIHGGTARYANLDYAASAPALATVVEELSRTLPFYASVHRGAGYASQASTACYESARRVVAGFLGARTDDHVVFTRNTTDSLNLLAHCVPGETVVLDVEHHANFLPWRRGGARVVEAAGTLAETLECLDRELGRRPAALLAVTGASNVTGEVLPIARLAKIAHRHGARILVDAAQLAPHRRIDLSECGIDYLALSGHKLYAPFGAGVLVGRADWLDAAEPYLAGGGAVRSVGLHETRWADGPARHEAGSPNVLGAAALAQACVTLAGLDRDRAHRHEQALVRLLVTGLEDLPGVTVHRIWGDPEGGVDTVGIATFTVAGHHPAEVATYLSAEHGIGVRHGKFCAHPLLDRLGLPDGAVRTSLGLGSTADDVERLIRAIDQLLTCGPVWDYAADARGQWAPVPETRTLPDFLGGHLIGDPAAGTPSTPPCGRD
ncbi:aminotransferase class V-fold PLP-dependent enzyme [Rhodococcus sp. D2-41]|uniref:Aminotransferase class V-fold PLP-dependent enzyme n=1 Tax=Speluncibacter jeojiensis TaxID=2710754 RepID=A0A9X4M6G9_9ACTN|nr:aminotransferase class V-fold PLP-dependent enzyme [Rhodococcus sp. D2-41]MDG3009326.1 aminotransferase class V-fold PLP-dependent enzyme [Rhodococcus sp. D2-41]MDG3016887.1 aminotransferase class V-fold PLP-dependent enzyme [Corynebacteriales bacterium D3-21]